MNFNLSNQHFIYFLPRIFFFFQVIKVKNWESQIKKKKNGKK